MSIVGISYVITNYDPIETLDQSKDIQKESPCSNRESQAHHLLPSFKKKNQKPKNLKEKNMYNHIHVLKNYIALEMHRKGMKGYTPYRQQWLPDRVVLGAGGESLLLFILPH